MAYFLERKEKIAGTILTFLIEGFLHSCALVRMDPRHRLRKTSGWCNEQCVRQVMALNKKEQSNLQQKLDQVQ